MDKRQTHHGQDSYNILANHFTEKKKVRTTDYGSQKES